MSPINIPIKPPPRVNIVDSVNGGGERGSTVAGRRCRRRKARETNKKRRQGEQQSGEEGLCEKSNPLPWGYYGDNLLLLFRGQRRSMPTVYA